MKKSVFFLLVVLRVLKVFCTIYGIEMSLSPPIFEPVQQTLQTGIRVKYISTLCFYMLLNIDRAVKKSAKAHRAKTF